MNDQTNDNGEESAANDCEQTESDTVERVIEVLSFDSDETVAVEIDVPSAMWAHIEMAIDENDAEESIEEWIVEAISHRITDLHEFDNVGQPMVELDKQEWNRIRIKALYAIQRGKDPQRAYWDAVFDHISATPDLFVEGESVGFDDLVPNQEQDHDRQH